MSLSRAFSLGTINVYLLGNQTRIGDNPQISYDQAVRHGAHRGKVAQLIVASNREAPGANLVINPNYDDVSYSDGVILTEYGSAGILQTADCPALILRNKKTGFVILAHAGRPALSGDPHCPSCTIVSSAFVRILDSDKDPEQIEALVIGDICGNCFKHDHADAEHLVAPFRGMPSQVFTDAETGSLNLFEVIKHMLTHAGVPARNIQRAGPCTFETPGLASYRENKTNLRNTIILINA